MEGGQVNLEFIRNIAKDNLGKIKDLIYSVDREIEVSVVEILESTTNGDWEKLAKVAHKLKSTVIIVGNHSLGSALFQLEMKLRNEPAEDMALSINKILDQLNETMDELQMELYEIQKEEYSNKQKRKKSFLGF